ncbi:MAG: hypothetical protein HOP29_05240 [Phycisphaerales bacterium]|nr:hypothetical protein [Phycisphaerales bacterium]
MQPDDDTSNPQWFHSLLQGVLHELALMNKQIARWRSAPADSIVGAWAPLLHEKLKAIETSLRQVTPGIESADRIPNLTSIGDSTSDACEPASRERTLAERIAETEKAAIASVLKTTRGNVTRTAVILDMSRTSLYTKIKEYGLPYS